MSDVREVWAPLQPEVEGSVSPGAPHNLEFQTDQQCVVNQPMAGKQVQIHRGKRNHARACREMRSLPFEVHVHAMAGKGTCRKCLVDYCPQNAADLNRVADGETAAGLDLGGESVAAWGLGERLETDPQTFVETAMAQAVEGALASKAPVERAQPQSIVETKALR
jgi:hypothetical protein